MKMALQTLNINISKFTIEWEVGMNSLVKVLWAIAAAGSLYLGARHAASDEQIDRIAGLIFMLVAVACLLQIK